MAIQNYALIANGVVVNTIIWDGDAENWQLPSGQSAVVIPVSPGGISIGWKYDGETFSAPA